METVRRRVADEEVREVLGAGERVADVDCVRLAVAEARDGRAFDLIWPLIGGGCHASRDTLAAIKQAGFEIASCELFLFKPFPLALPTAPHIRGIARRPTTP